MSEPTNWIGEFDGETLVYVHPVTEFNDGGFVAKQVHIFTDEQLAHVRQKAASDALERAIVIRDLLSTDPYGNGFFISGYITGTNEYAEAIRALKDQPTGGA